MTPAFGFSAGDFIALIGLVKRVSKGLKDTDGASSEYQHVIVELNGLEKVLESLAALEPCESNVNHVNAIRGMALACRLPLQEFLTKLEKYESSMGPFATGRSFRGVRQKAEWAVFTVEDVNKLRALVSGKIISIHSLLGLHASESLSRLESRGKAEHNTLLAKILENKVSNAALRSKLDGIKEKVARVESLSDQVVNEQAKQATNFSARLEQLNHSTKGNTARLDAIAITANSTQSSVTRMRNIGEQIVSFISTFPTEIRDLIKTLTRSNMQIYSLLLQVQSNVFRSPTLLLQSNIRFEDALGVVRELPYDWFRHWEPFEGLLRAQFKDAPGSGKVLEGLYYIVDAKRPGALIDKEKWPQSVFPGSEISMSMIITHLHKQIGVCPRCRGKQASADLENPIIVCPDCGLKCFPTLNEAGQDPAASDEIQIITKRQLQEDLEIFGGRNGPIDLEEIGNVMTTNVPKLSSLFSEETLQQTDTRGNTIRQSERSTFFDTRNSNLLYSGIKDTLVNPQGDDAGPHEEQPRSFSESKTNATPNAFGSNNVQLDLANRNGMVSSPKACWQETDFPLQSWLNQSIVSTEIMSSHESQRRERAMHDKMIMDHERKEIEVFRNVHISESNDSLPADPQREAMLVDKEEVVEPGARIYLRNIYDKYPLIPPFLAQRLAEANLHRKKRLKSEIFAASRLVDQPEEKSFQGKGLRERNLLATNILQNSDEETEKSFSRKLSFPYWCSSENFPSRVNHLKRQLWMGNHNAMLRRIWPTPEFSRSNPLMRSLTVDPDPSAGWCGLQVGGEGPMSAPSTPTPLQARELISFSRMVTSSRADPTLKIFSAQVKNAGLGNSEDKILLWKLFAKCSDSIEEGARLQNLVWRMLNRELLLGHGARFTWSPHSIPYTEVIDPIQIPALIDALRGGKREKQNIPILPDIASVDKVKLFSRKKDISGGRKSALFVLGGSSNESESSTISSSRPSVPALAERISNIGRTVSFEEGTKQDFWSHGNRNLPRRRTRSSISNMNSSLRGLPVFDREEQEPVFSMPPSRNSSFVRHTIDPRCSIGIQSSKTHSEAEDDPTRVLPPPPCELGKQLSFECDICGQEVHVTRRREWKKHVFADLLPYLCIFEDCTDRAVSYPSRRAFAEHLMHSHPMQKTCMLQCHCGKTFSNDASCIAEHVNDFFQCRGPKGSPRTMKVTNCPLCGDLIELTQRMLGRHIGRHMEEISFAVVTKPYEDWKFYNDTSSEESLKRSLSWT